MADWLTPEGAAALIELGTLSAEESPSWTAAVDAATEYVEGKRGDLFTDADPPVFVPGATVKLGTAALAHRWWQRRTSPLGTSGYSEYGADTVLRHDPDIAKMLGLGTAGAFMFAAAIAPETEPVLPVDPEAP